MRPTSLSCVAVGALLGLGACAFPEPPDGAPPPADGPAGPPPGSPAPDAETRRLVPTDDTPADVQGAVSCEVTAAAAENTPAGGAAARIAGTVTWDGPVLGRILIDLVDPASMAPVYGFECRGTGALSLEVPASLGTVVVVGFVDNSQDGPTADDAQGRVEAPVDLAAGGASGLVLGLVEGAAVAGYRYAGPAPEAGEAPPVQADPSTPGAEPEGAPPVGNGPPGGPPAGDGAPPE